MTRENRTLQNLFSDISQAAVRHWLKTRDYEHTWRNTPDFYRRLNKLLNDEVLQMADFVNAAINIEESGGKQIILANISDVDQIPRDLPAHARSLYGRDISFSPIPAVKRPRQPILNYIHLVEEGDAVKEIRAKFTETQVKRSTDYETGQVNSENVTKIAVIVGNLQTGLVQIRLDSSEKVHSHKDEHGKSKEAEYINFYRNRAIELLGSSLQSLDLTDFANWLSRDSRGIFDLHRAGALTAAGSFATFTSRTKETDVRDDRSYLASVEADEGDSIPETNSGYWLQGTPSRDRLQRRLFMRINRRESSIYFLADCLAEEIDYVLSRIAEFN